MISRAPSSNIALPNAHAMKDTIHAGPTLQRTQDNNGSSPSILHTPSPAGQNEMPTQEALCDHKRRPAHSSFGGEDKGVRHVKQVKPLTERDGDNGSNMNAWNDDKSRASTQTPAYPAADKHAGHDGNLYAVRDAGRAATTTGALRSTRAESLSDLDDAELEAEMAHDWRDDPAREAMSPSQAWAYQMLVDSESRDNKQISYDEAVLRAAKLDPLSSKAAIGTETDSPS